MGRKKARRNFVKHRISFEEAMTVFRDPLSVTALDPDHFLSEKRFVTFGVSTNGILLQVSHTERGGLIRIISARTATKSETQIYMKKAKSELNDWGRSEYKRSDLGELVRGKYAQRLSKSSVMVLLEPDVAEAFPNSEAVNKALRSLISTNRQPRKLTVSTKRKKSTTTKKHKAA